MLKQILVEIEKAGSAVNLVELSRKLGVAPSALEGMMAYLVQKGKLHEEDPAAPEAGIICKSGGCGSCPGVESCPFVMKMPRSFSLPAIEEVQE